MVICILFCAIVLRVFYLDKMSVSGVLNEGKNGTFRKLQYVKSLSQRRILMKSWIQAVGLAVVGILLLAGTIYAQSSSGSRGGWRWEWQEPSISDIRDRSTEIFEILDADANGSINIDEIDLTNLSEEETAELSNEELRVRRHRSSLASSMFLRWNDDMDAFDISDSNGDGFMTREEFENRRVTLRTRMLEEGIASYDKDKNGSVELLEFNANLASLEDIDKDGSGTLSRSELSKVDNRELMRSVRMSQARSWDSRRSSFYSGRNSQSSPRSRTDSN